MIVIPHKLNFLRLLGFFCLSDWVFDDEGHHVPAKIFHAHLACCGDQIELIFPAHRFSNGFRFGFSFGFIHQVDLVKDQPTRFSSQLIAVFFQFANDDTGIFNRI
ncbi:hypothetical protein D3C86_1934970 [compost metagenome]